MNENLMILIYGFAVIGFLGSCVAAGLYAGMAVGWLLTRLGWLR